MEEKEEDGDETGLLYLGNLAQTQAENSLLRGRSSHCHILGAAEDQSCCVPRAGCCKCLTAKSTPLKETNLN